MKRFYCTVCKRMKRVRKYPTSVQQVNSETPSQRIGQCTWHIRGRWKAPNEAQADARMIRKVVQ